MFEDFQLVVVVGCKERPELNGRVCLVVDREGCPKGKGAHGTYYGVEPVDNQGIYYMISSAYLKSHKG